MGTATSPTFPLDRKWPFRIALAVWLAIGVGAWFLADGMGRPGQVVLAGLWVVGLALLLRQFLLSLFGPVLAYEVLRVGRQSRQIWFRLAYAIILAFLFCWIYFAWVSFRGPGQVVRPRDLSLLAETYFGVYMVVQFILVCVLTPASVAGAIAEEKERRTLEFLLATDLRDREILFGKLATRVGSLLLFLGAGLPILTLMQFFGGIDPDQVIAGFAATVLVVLSLAALGMAASVLARKARDAIALTYLTAVAYVIGSFLVYALAIIPALKWDVDILGYAVSSEDAAYPIVAGNPFFMVPEVLETRGGRTTDLFTPLWHFAAFHLFVIAIFLAWAGLRLRSIALAQTFGSTRRSIFQRLVPSRREKSSPAPRRRVSPRKPTRPEVGSAPILWKEVFVDAGLRMGAFGKVVVMGLVGLSFVPIAFIFWFSFVDSPGWQDPGDWWSIERWEQFGEGMNGYLRVAGTVATSLVFLAVAVRGAGVISGERDRHTLDVLLTTPLNAPTIVWGKWWGCILGMRWAWAWVFSLWVLTLAAGGVHPIMFPAAIISIAVYASGYAWIGIFCSLQMRSTLRATMGAILLSIFCGGGYFLIFLMCCVLPLSFGPGPGNDMRVFVDLLCSFSPPVNLGWLPVHELSERKLSLFSRDIPYPPFWILGLIAWGAFSVALSHMCVMKFRRLANRLPMVPEGSVRLVRGPPPLPRF